MIPDFLLLSILLGFAMLISVRTGKLTIAAAFTGGITGVFIYLGAGYVGLAMIAVFFITGTAATSWKITYKENLGLAEKNKGRRSAGQVIANAGVAGLLGLLIWIYDENATLFRLMMAAGLASATGDTLSSELGNVYGRKYYNIISFKKDKRGLNGVVSVEGSFFGIVGSAVIAAIYGYGFGWNNFVWIVAAGIIGNISDSILGATLERRNYLNNDTVNFLNTLVAALAAALLYTLTK